MTWRVGPESANLSKMYESSSAVECCHGSGEVADLWEILRERGGAGPYSTPVSVAECEASFLLPVLLGRTSLALFSDLRITTLDGRSLGGGCERRATESLEG